MKFTNTYFIATKAKTLFDLLFKEKFEDLKELLSDLKLIGKILTQSFRCSKVCAKSKPKNAENLKL